MKPNPAPLVLLGLVLILLASAAEEKPPAPAASRLERAIELLDQGKHAKDEAEFRVVLAIRERESGEENADTLWSRTQLTPTPRLMTAQRSCTRRC
jgi:hypothetical protein